MIKIVPLDVITKKYPVFQEHAYLLVKPDAIEDGLVEAIKEKLSSSSLSISSIFRVCVTDELAYTLYGEDFEQSTTIEHRLYHLWGMRNLLGICLVFQLASFANNPNEVIFRLKGKVSQPTPDTIRGSMVPEIPSFANDRTQEEFYRYRARTRVHFPKSTLEEFGTYQKFLELAQVLPHFDFHKEA